MSTFESLESFFASSGWEVAFETERPARPGQLFSADDLTLSPISRAALAAYDGKAYGHQHDAIAAYVEGRHVAVTTPTASGKTLVFNIAALEELAKDPNACIAAVYPLKALASEQADRWRQLVKRSNLKFQVGRIDGGVKMSDRLGILAASRIVVLTPDIIHAWLLSSIAQKVVQKFLRNLKLVVIDEAHDYKGVFGSNAAFLFRRLLHVVRKLGGTVRFVASSATMNGASDHLTKLTGETFTVIGPDQDTSPRAKLKTLLVNPPKDKDLLTSISDLIDFAAKHTDHQSITFVDSRKQTEYLAAIVERHGSADAEDVDKVDFDRMERLQVYPYRSGYEEADRQRIQEKLASGRLKGVVSTSALEMGIDLPHLTLGILIGIPASGTSYYQRVGRVGRKSPGMVIVVNNHTVMSESVFREPERLTNLPLSTSALYLHNQRIQYIHAMCLARPGGEDEVSCHAAGISDEPFMSPQDLPDDFLALCQGERLGEVSSELQSMKAQAGDDPHHTFPLRDLDMQFKVESRLGPGVTGLGTLSFSQLMREAYPGAVYYYQTTTYRVTRIRKQLRQVDVRPEKRYSTKPLNLPTQVFPNMSGENLFQAWRYGQLSVIECAMQVRDAVTGFKERRGNNEFEVSYPLDAASTGIYQDSAKFAYYMFTSGVILTHPALNRHKVKQDEIAALIRECFLMHLPFERQDVSDGADKHRTARDGIEADDRFVCVYDQTYGSLRLTSRLAETVVLREVLARAAEIAHNDPNLGFSPQSLEALDEMVASANLEPQLATSSVPSVPTVASGATATHVHVILPGSMGIDTHQDNEEFEVEAVFFSPMLGTVAYRGHRVSSKKKELAANGKHSETTVIVRADHIAPVQGESKLGWFSLETGAILDEIPSP